MYKSKEDSAKELVGTLEGTYQEILAWISSVLSSEGYDQTAALTDDEWAALLVAVA